MIRSRSVAVAWFVLSVATLGVAYGIAANQWGWFPSSIARQAWQQAEVYLGLRTARGFSHLSPRVYDHSGVRITNQNRTQPGFTLITSMWKTSDGWEPKIRLIREDGQVAHEWHIDRDIMDRTNYVHGTHLFPSGDVIANIEYVGTVRLNSCGRVLWQLPRRTHHSVARADSSSFWIPARAGRKTDQYPGLGSVESETILRVSGTGEVLREISVLNLLYKNDLQHYIFAIHGSKLNGDLTHLNDVERLSSTIADEYPLFDAGDLLVSLRDLNLVFVFDPDTRIVKWWSSDIFIRQHDPDFIGRGWIGIFDNNVDGTRRGTVLGGSRIVAVQPHSDSTRIIYPTKYSGPFYTEAGGKWQKLDNGHMLLTEAQAGRIVEVAPDGSTVWEWIKTPNGTKVAEVLEGSRFNFGSDEVEAWPCSSSDSIN